MDEFESYARDTQSITPSIRVNAEHLLHQYTLRPDFPQLLKHIVANGTPLAQFHVLNLLRHHLKSTREDWRPYLTTLMLEPLQHEVRGAVARNLAVCVRDGWTGRESADMVTGLLEEGRMEAFVFIHALLVEFERSSSDKHVAHRMSFQRSFMATIFTHLVHTLIQTSSMASLICLEDMIHWDFSGDVRMVLAKDVRDTERGPLRLPIEWRDSITGILPLLFGIAGRGGDAGMKASRCLIVLAGLEGSALEGRREEYVTEYVHLLGKYLSTIMSVLSSSFAGHSETIFAVAHMAMRLFRYSGNIAGRCAGIEEVLNNLGIMTIGCLKELDEEWEVVGEELLEMWGSLVMKSSEISADICGILGQISKGIVECFIEVRVLRESEDEDEVYDKDVDFYSEQLLNIAILARSNPSEVLSTLINILSEKSTILNSLFNNYQPQNEPVMMKLQEQLHFTVLIAGHVLADCSYGETAMVCEDLLKLSLSAGHQNDPLVIIVTSIFSILDSLSFPVNSNQHNSCSPLLIETLFWFCDRWTTSYLFIKAEDYPGLSLSLLQTFGVEGGGPDALLFLLTKAEELILIWYTEEDVVDAIVNLLQGLSKITIARDRMIEMQKFSDLVNFLLTNISKLPSSSHSPIIQTVVYIATHTSNKPMREVYFKSICGTIESALLSIIQNPLFRTNYQSTDVREGIIVALEMFNGLTISVDEATTKMIFEACSRHFSNFVILLDLYHEYPDLELFILKIFKDLVKNQSFDVLEPAERQLLHSSVHDLIQVYTKNEIGRHRRLKCAEEDELYEDLSALLQLLAELIMAEYEGYDDVPKVVFTGVNALLPLVTRDMLDYPGLCLDYIRLVGLLIDYFPDSLLESLIFGTNQHQNRITESSFKAIQSLGLYSWSQMVAEILLSQIIQGLLMKPLDSSNLSAASDSVFALGLCCPDVLNQILISISTGSEFLQPLTQQLIACISDNQQKQLAKLMQGSMQIGWGGPGLERFPSLNPYRKLFAKLVIDARASIKQ